MNAKKVIIDCDPGIDDALALMLALSLPELRVLGITAVCGNVPAEKGAQNACKVLEWMDRTDIPVYIGEEKPLVRGYVDAMDTHGRDGLGESGCPAPVQCSPQPGAVEFLSRELRAAARRGEEISIIALGPLTNIARLIQRDPKSLQGLAEFVSMGGSYKSHGNCSPVAEYNYWCDPHAAKLVYRAFETCGFLKGKRIHMVGLDVTRQIVLTPDLLEYMCFIRPALGERIRAVTRFYMDFHWKQEGIIGCVVNDPLAVAYFARRALCSGFAACTEIETEGICAGQSVVDAFDFWKRPQNSIVLTRTDAAGFWRLFLERVLGADAESAARALRPVLADGAEKGGESCAR